MDLQLRLPWICCEWPSLSEISLSAVFASFPTFSRSPAFVLPVAAVRVCAVLLRPRPHLFDFFFGRAVSAGREVFLLSASPCASTTLEESTMALRLCGCLSAVQAVPSNRLAVFRPRTSVTGDACCGGVKGEKKIVLKFLGGEVNAPSATL